MTLGGVAAEGAMVGNNLGAHLEHLQKKMRDAAADLDFETAARLRDEIKRLEALELGLEPQLAGRSLRDATPRAEWKPKPLGPGGGGYDPKKMKGGRKRA